jgi:hypothetical protein
MRKKLYVEKMKCGKEMKCGEFGMWQICNVLDLECVRFGICRIWNVLYLECGECVEF